ncbi:MAG: hypothetical protein WCK49_06145 [Myxococcaceae bacterium]
MIWVVGVLWALSFVSLLKPFIDKKTGLETLDALDIFAVRQSILLCLLVFALYPTWPTGLMAFISLAPKATFRRGLILGCLSVLSTQLMS